MNTSLNRYQFIAPYPDKAGNVAEAHSKLYSLIDKTTQTHRPVLITGERSNTILVSEQDWNAISETLHLLSVPRMRESFQDQLKQDLGETSAKLDW